MFLGAGEEWRFQHENGTPDELERLNYSSERLAILKIFGFSGTPMTIYALRLQQLVALLYVSNACMNLTN